MPHSIKFIFLLFGIGLYAQPETEVYLVDIASSEGKIKTSNLINVSNNLGYDNQPSFYDTETLVFAKNIENQTDIAAYNIGTKETNWYNTKTEGGEYSPQRIPTTENIAAVRLDPDGKQRLYIYSKNGTNKEAIADLEVAYFAFHNNHQILASILSDDQLDLVVVDLNKGLTFEYLPNTGRSIHKRPNSKSVSYTTYNYEKNHDIYLVNIDDEGDSFFVCQLPIGVQDYAWLDENKLMAGSGSKLYLYDLFGNGNWQEVADFSEEKIKNITRLSVSPDGKKIAMVGEFISE